jgi:hypothetical protein
MAILFSLQARIKAKTNPFTAIQSSFNNPYKSSRPSVSDHPRVRHASTDSTGVVASYAPTAVSLAPNFLPTQQQPQNTPPRVYQNTQVPVGYPASYPFYSPATQLQPWNPPQSQNVGYDLSSVIQFNGLSPYKPINGTARPVIPRPPNQHKQRNANRSVPQIHHNQPNHPQIQVLTSTASAVVDDKSLTEKTSTRLPLNVSAALPIVVNETESVAPATQGVSGVIVSHVVPSTPVFIPPNPHLHPKTVIRHQANSLDNNNTNSLIVSNSSNNSSSSGKKRNPQDSVPTNRSTSGNAVVSGFQSENRPPSQHHHHNQQHHQSEANGPTLQENGSGQHNSNSQQVNKNYKARTQVVKNDRIRRNPRENDASTNLTNDRSRKESSPRSSSKASSFDLEATSFPPLPGAVESNPTVVDPNSAHSSSDPSKESNVVSNTCNGSGCLADVVKGTASKKESDWSRRSSKENNSNCSISCASFGSSEQHQESSSSVSNNGANNGGQACDNIKKDKEVSSKTSQSIEVSNHDSSAHSPVPVSVSEVKQSHPKEGVNQEFYHLEDSSTAANGHFSDTESDAPSKVLSYCDVLRKARDKQQEAEQDKKQESVIHGQTLTDLSHLPSSKAPNREYIPAAVIESVNPSFFDLNRRQCLRFPRD